MSGTIELKFDKKTYLEHKGHICPYCKSRNIEETEPLQRDGEYGTQQIECNDCGNEWKDFSIIKIVDVKEE